MQHDTESVGYCLRTQQRSLVSRLSLLCQLEDTAERDVHEAIKGHTATVDFVEVDFLISRHKRRTSY
jgi:hypothetical protein